MVQDLSTGQATEARLEQILGCPRQTCVWRVSMEKSDSQQEHKDPAGVIPQVLLLDEWSSPLSNNRFAACQAKIQTLAWTLGVRVIVEIVHPSHSLQPS